MVFDWQLEDLKRMLGVHAPAFDVGAWFVTLDARLVESPSSFRPRWRGLAPAADAHRSGAAGPPNRGAGVDRLGGREANDTTHGGAGKHSTAGGAVMSLLQFTDVFIVLASQLRCMDGDEPVIRAYYDVLKHIELEFIQMAAARLARNAEWFPKRPSGARCAPSSNSSVAKSSGS